MDRYGRLLHDVLFPGFEAVRGRPTVGLMRYLDRTQWASRDELHAIQSGFLRRLIRHATQHTAHFRQVFDQRGLGLADIRTPDDLVKLPVMDKPTARVTTDARTADVPPFAVVNKMTSGSTGLPMQVAYNAESQHWRNATKWRGWSWGGYQPGVKALHYWGVAPAGHDTRFSRAKIALDRALNRNHFIDCQPSDDAWYAHVCDEIVRLRPEIIMAYAQAAASLARYIQRAGARRWGDIPVLYGAEALYPEDRAVISAQIGPVYETYGCREVTMIGAECEGHHGLHTAMETMIVELLVREPDGSFRRAAPGESGEVALTDLHNLAVPLIRYLNGDIAVAHAPARCACGRWLDRIGPVEGRVSEAVVDRHGNKVNGILFSVLFTHLGDGIKQWQAIQRLDGSILVKLVMARGTPDAAMQAAIRTFLARYLRDVPIAVEQVTEIPTGPSGKRRVVLVERPAVSSSR